MPKGKSVSDEFGASPAPPPNEREEDDVELLKARSAAFAEREAELRRLLAAAYEELLARDRAFSASVIRRSVGRVRRTPRRAMAALKDLLRRSRARSTWR
jgi:hypothetical protein